MPSSPISSSGAPRVVGATVAGAPKVVGTYSAVPPIVPQVHESTLREVVELLADIARPPCSQGEREAAEWIGERLREAGADRVALEREPAWGTFPPNLAGLGALSCASAALVLAGRRGLGVLGAAVSIAGMLDEGQNGPRLLRRAFRRRTSTVNVVARAGDPRAARTLVVLAHHDAPQTGVIFRQDIERLVHAWVPWLLQDAKRPLPQWWLGLAAPLGALVGALTGRRGPVRLGLAGGLLATALVADIWRSPTVAGANDNLSGVAALTALAEMLRESPLPGVRVMLVSCGAEEALQDGVRAFLARHREELDPARTWVLNLDTVGSPELAMVEGEGPFWMERYAGPEFRDLVAECARGAGIELERGLLAASSTDGIIPSRSGYPTATLVSLNPWRCLSNYHLPSDLPENLDYDSIASATAVSYLVARELAAL